MLMYIAPIIATMVLVINGYVLECCVRCNPPPLPHLAKWNVYYGLLK